MYNCLFVRVFFGARLKEHQEEIRRNTATAFILFVFLEDLSTHCSEPLSIPKACGDMVPLPLNQSVLAISILYNNMSKPHGTTRLRALPNSQNNKATRFPSFT